MTEQRPVWPVRDRFLELRSHWFTLIGEHLIGDREQILEYWRIERADSVIILPLYNTEILVMPPTYRPGLSRATVDFPGGRLAQGQTLEAAAYAILERELGTPATAIRHLECLNPAGWPINSSFSNQLLYGFWAFIEPTYTLPPERIGFKAEATPTGMQEILKNLDCLQCRLVLLDWWISFRRAQQDSNL